MKKKIEAGTKFFYGELHTIEQINESFVVHSYEYINAKGETCRVEDGTMYRSVFDKLVTDGVINIM